MPQGNLRSGVYRSFIMCDDPRGVVESGAIRKQKSRSNSSRSSGGDGGNRKHDHPWKGKEQRVPCQEKPEMPKKMSVEIGFNASSSLQLLRVSRGIQKLNEAIESWSKGLSCEVSPNEVAKDLLRGALDLEESLDMLGRFQEASSESTKQKPRSSSHGKEGRDDARFQRSLSDRFVERNHEKVAPEKRRIQDEASPRDCYEELRRMITESFVQQNLLPRTTEAMNLDCRSKFGASSSEAASTSSSQATSVHGNDSGSTKSSLLSDIPPRISAKSPNLIARLMGLDALPVEHAKSTVHADKPVIKKPPCEGQELMNTVTRETELHKVVRSNSVKEIALQSPQPYRLNNRCPEETLISNNPSTIVLIKPLHVPQPETEAAKAKSKTPVVPNKPRMQGEIHPRMISHRKDRAAGSSITSNKMKLPLSLTVREKDMKKTVVKLDEREAKKAKQTTSSNTKTSENAGKALKPAVNNKTVAKKKDADGKDPRRSQSPVRKPRDNAAEHNKSNSSSVTSTGQRSKLVSKSTTGEEKQVRARKAGEAKRPNAKKNPRKQDNAGKDLTSANSSVSSRNTIRSVNQVSAEEETTSSEFHVQGQDNAKEISSRDTSIQHSHDDDKNPETCTVCKRHDAETSLKSFLSNSPAFLSHAEELFHVNTNTTKSPKPSIKNGNSIVIPDQRLALDLAKEVATRKSLQLSRTTSCPQRLCISMEELLMEVSDGFEALRSYRNTFSGQNYLSDSVHMMLEKDMKSAKTEMMSGIWDLGWISGFRLHETHQVVVDVEKLILGGLIEDILS